MGNWTTHRHLKFLDPIVRVNIIMLYVQSACQWESDWPFAEGSCSSFGVLSCSFRVPLGVSDSDSVHRDCAHRSSLSLYLTRGLELGNHRGQQVRNPTQGPGCNLGEHHDHVAFSACCDRTTAPRAQPTSHPSCKPTNYLFSFIVYSPASLIPQYTANPAKAWVQTCTCVPSTS